jgi:hypothetical protein
MRAEIYIFFCLYCYIFKQKQLISFFIIVTVTAYITVALCLCCKTCKCINTKQKCQYIFMNSDTGKVFIFDFPETRILDPHVWRTEFCFLLLHPHRLWFTASYLANGCLGLCHKGQVTVPDTSNIWSNCHLQMFTICPCLQTFSWPVCSFALLSQPTSSYYTYISTSRNSYWRHAIRFLTGHCALR